MAANPSVLFRKKLYDVFISFRGEDTRNTFTCHLYDAFLHKKIKAYIDEESLKKGDEISTSLLKAIQESKISVVILSENYATSSWCLEELGHILQCKETDEQIVIPVFYNVEPSNVRHQKESYATAFTAHEKRFCDKMDKVQKWKNALTIVSDLSGFHSSSVTGSDAKLVEAIVKEVMGKLNCLSSSNYLKEKDLVGMDKRIEQFQSFLNNGSQEVRIVGIWGIGGIGKTTLARDFFHRFASQFEGCFFLENVKEESKRRGLTNLQKALFSKLLGEGSSMEVNDLAKDRLQRTEALVVLDDVDSAKQLEYLVEHDSFGPGSKIIITTRDSQVLNNIADREIYPVEGLNFEEALQLFCSKAFRQNSPPEDYELLSRRVVKYTQGLPLALKVLGSHLHSKRPESWESALNKLKKCPNKEIHEVLRISYDGLERNEKEMFLDIACFFNGQDKEFVERKLHARDLDVEIGIDILTAKSLITLEGNSLRTHDLLQEMGWEIVREESYNEPGKRSRLWLDKDIYHVLKYNTGTKEVQGISLNTYELESGIDLDPLVFKDMINLKYLSITEYFDDLNKKLNLPQGLLSLPDELRYLCWNRYPSRTLPPNFKPQNLVELNLRRSKLEKLWDGVQNFGSLKVIDLGGSKNLIEIPNLSQALNVEKICLTGCTSLERLPSSIGKLKSLQLLHLDWCTKLEYMPEISEPMPNLRVLDLWRSGIIDLPKSFYNLIGIESLVLCSCQNLKSLPTSMCKLKSLEEHELSFCSKLEYLPEILEPMPNIRKLGLIYSGIIDLPKSIYNLIGIEYLRLDECQNLKSLPTSICKLKSLIKLKLSSCSKLEYLPEISEPMPNLLYLDLRNSGIIDLQKSIYNLIGIQHLNLNECQNLKSLPTSIWKLKSLKQLHLSFCSKLEYLPEILEPMPNLYDLDLSKSGIIDLPKSIYNLIGIHHLNLNECQNLKSLPTSIWKLKSLIELELSSCSKLEYLPEISEPMPNLLYLDLRNSGIIDLPKSIYNLIGIHDLNLNKCQNLKSLPTSIWKLKSLIYLVLYFCSKLEYLPEILEPMPNLYYLNLSKSGIIDLPKSIYNLIGIKYLHLNECQNLKSLPTSICKLKSLKELRLSFCSKLKYFPEILEPMPNLTMLDLDGSGIRKLPMLSLENVTRIDLFSLHDCTNLELILHTNNNKDQHLEIIGFQKLKSLPCPLSSGTNLVQSLSLTDTSVSRIPNNLFSCLNFLLNLELARTNIRRIPENIKFSKLHGLDIRGCRFLQSLPELPLTIEKVDASGCTSLKMVSNLLTALTQPPTDRVNLGVAFSFMDCLKLEHQNLMSEFQMRASLIATALALGKTPYKVNPLTTKMCYPGDNIPEWFSYQKKGRSINIQLPYNSNFMGFAFCFILSYKKYKGSYPVEINLDGEIFVKTIYGDERHLRFPLTLLPSNAKNHVSMTTFMCNIENFYSAVEMSFNFRIDEEADVKIKRSGIRLLYVQDAMEFGIISSQYVCRKSNVVNDEGGPSLFWEGILQQLRHFQVSSSRKKLCEKIWSSNLNRWYKILWWQLLRDALPVRAALKHAGDTSCPLCGSGMESAIHLFLFCKRVRLLWFMSQWRLRTDSLLCDSMASFLEIVLDRFCDRDFLIYASLLVDTIWWARNKLVYDGKVFHVAEIHSSVQAQFNQISTSKEKEEVEEFDIEEEEELLFESQKVE